MRALASTGAAAPGWLQGVPWRRNLRPHMLLLSHITHQLRMGSLHKRAQSAMKVHFNSVESQLEVFLSLHLIRSTG